MPDTGRPERLQVMLTADELSALDDWRFARRMPSRAAAIRDLLRRGLAAEGVALAAPGKQSSNFGVLPEPGRGGGQNGGRPSAD
jgi:hypothetical protein